jgi:hypothetical protein
MSETLQIQRINPAQELGPLQRAQNFAKTFAITTKEDADLVKDELSRYATIRSQLEAKRVQYTGPLNKVVDAINDDFRPLIKGWDALILSEKNKVIAYQQQQDALAEEQARIAREESARQAAAQAAIAAKAEQAAKCAEASAATATTQAEAEGFEIESNIQRETAASAMTAAHMAVAAPAPNFKTGKVKGVGQSWDAECFDLKALVLHIAKSPNIDQLLSLLTIDNARLRAKAKLETTAFALPGCKAFDKGRMVIRKSNPTTTESTADGEHK